MLIALMCVFKSFSQLPKVDFENELQRLEKAIQSKNTTLILKEVDSLKSSNSLSEIQLAIVTTYKLQALTESWKLDQAIKLATELYSQNLLSKKYKVRVWLSEALILEIYEEFTDGLKKLDSVEQYYNTHPKDQYYGIFLYRKSSLFRMSGNKKAALPLAYEAKKFGETNDYDDVVSIAIFLIDRLSDPDDYKQRLKDLELAIKNYEALENFDDMAFALKNIAVAYKENGEYNKAKKMLLKGLHIKKSRMKDSITMMLIYDELDEIYEMQNVYDSAYYYLKKSKELNVMKNLTIQRQSISKLEEAKENLKIKFEEKRYGEQLESVNYEKKLLVFVLSVFGVLLTLLILALGRIKKKNKENKTQKEEILKKNKLLGITLSERNVLLRELNHRVKNNLSLIVSLINFHANETDDINSQKILNNLENRVKTIAEAHEQFSYKDISSINDKIELKTYLTRVLDGPIHISKREISYTMDAKDIALNMDTLLPIGILINELVNNSIKHAVSNETTLQLHIKCDLENNIILLQYSDSGTKFIEKKETKQLGLFIIESMVQQLNGIYSREQSRYHFKLNLKKDD
ncbi:sensor histidine kinase [Psychroserpens ponticola]|uniref:histidine kinase n=1 Tax=Psychroserpens ponticola TaxID=2932268 RepID=A0ABY7RVL4_9FLAO|nr:sensor histidine kinase [Psychroserpens ponticola]WCO00741.1 sensor histidine kinase [Psychroserpens ponticola]